MQPELSHKSSRLHARLRLVLAAGGVWATRVDIYELLGHLHDTTETDPPARGKSQVLLLLLLGNLHSGNKESVERMPLAPRPMNGPLNQAIMRAFVATAKTYANYEAVAIVMKMPAVLPPAPAPTLRANKMLV